MELCGGMVMLRVERHSAHLREQGRIFFTSNVNRYRAAVMRLMRIGILRNFFNYSCELYNASVLITAVAV